MIKDLLLSLIEDPSIVELNGTPGLLFVIELGVGLAGLLVLTGNDLVVVD
jgi:hypothetical protein